MEDQKLQVILLAAGQGIRMGGQNKLLLPFRGSSVLEETLTQLCAADIGQVYVVTGYQRDLIAPMLVKFPVLEINNPDFKAGMTGSIQTGVGAAVGGLGYMICLADMPMISAAAYKSLSDTFFQYWEQDNEAILLPRFGKLRGNPVILSEVYRKEILAHSKPEGCKEIIQKHAAHCYWADVADSSVLQDLDTLEDYARITE